MAKESKTHLQQQVPKLVIIAFLFLRGGEAEALLCIQGFIDSMAWGHTTAQGIWLFFCQLVMEGNPSSSYSFQ